jgi:protein-S-isoprenylcysteine O-methyltransferase
MAIQMIVPWQLWVGSLLMLSGVLLRWLAIRTLAEHFITAVRVREQQPLVQSSVYRWMRHPSETGLLTTVLGAVVLLNSSWAALLWGMGLIPTTLVRLQHEECSLAEGFGISFQQYARRVKRLIPFVI